MLESSIRIRLRELNLDRDMVIVNQGIDGDSTRGMLERFIRSVEPEKPDVVLLWGGINDLSTRSSPEDVFPNIVELVERTNALGAIPIVLNVAPVSGPHFNETVEALNTLTRDYCEENEVLYVDVFSHLADEEGKLASEYSNDGVHLSDQGYRKIMTPIFQTLLMVIDGLL